MSIYFNKISFYFFTTQIAFMHLYMYYGGLDYIYYIPFINQIIPLIGVVFMGILFVYNLKSNINLYSILFFIFIFFIFIYSFGHYSAYIIINEDLTLRYFINDAFSIIQFLFFFFVGSYFRGYEQYRIYIFIFYTLLLVSIILNFDFEKLAINLINSNNKENNDYLFLADTFAIWSILTIAYIKNYNIKLFVILVSVVGLFTLMSRASLAVFVITILFYFMWNREVKRNIVYLICIGVAIGIFLLNSIDISDLGNYRMFSYLISGEDVSASERTIMHAEGIESIKNNWFIGDYGQEVIYFGVLGTYIHSYLQLLRQYGIIPFIIFLFLCYMIIINIYNIIKIDKINDQNYLFLVLLSVFLILELIFAKSLNSGSPYFFFLVGAFLSKRVKVKFK